MSGFSHYLSSIRRETHGPRVELLRHFTGTLFDSEVAGASDEWTKAVAGFFAALLSLGIVFIQTFTERYNLLQKPPSTRLIYGAELRSDEFLFIGLAMAITALLTLLLWQSLFPSQRDVLALAGLPVSAAEVFAGKFAAVAFVFGGYVVALNLPWALLFATATSGRWQENPSALANVGATFAATAGACCFVFFSLMALQGILLNVLPARVFDAASRWVQAGLFIATMGAAPLLGKQPRTWWWPGTWFLGLWEAIQKADAGVAVTGLAAIAGPIAIALAAYMASYHRYRRVLLEAPRERSGEAVPALTTFGAWLLEKWIPEPTGQAAFSFIWKTLTRSRGHRLVLLAYGGLALGWIVKGALDMDAPSLRDEGMYGMLVTVSPLALALLMISALRYLFSLPVAPGANWVFRIADREGTAAWLRAVEKFAIWCGIAPVFAAGFPAAVAVLGLVRASGVTALSFLMAVVWFEVLFRQWRKLPFTCHYLPAKQSTAVVLARYGIAFPVLAMLGGLFLYCSTELAAFAALITLQAATWWRLRRRRRTAWEGEPLLYEDLAEAEVNPLRLGEVTRYVETEPSPMVGRQIDFMAGLTASRGWFPAGWSAEIDEERHGSIYQRHRTFLSSVAEDVRFGLRLIRRNARVSALVVLTLTAGIGINATIFTIVNGLVLRSHIRQDPDKFVEITAVMRTTLQPRESSFAEYVAYREGARSLRQVAAWARMNVTFGDNDSGETGLGVSCNFFAVAGVARPKLGRLLVEDDCRAPGQAAVAVLSETTWRNRFGAQADIVGRTIQLNNRAVPVVGVVADGTSAWTGGRPVGVWVPYTSQLWFNSARNRFQDPDSFWLSLAGRIAPGYTRDLVRAELLTIAMREDRRNPGRATSIAATDGSWIERLELRVTGRSLLLPAFFFGAFNLVLFIACANVATLLLTRAAARRREIAVRLALGAPRIRLVRMLVTESVLLAALAGAASGYLVWRAPVPLARYLLADAPVYSLPPDWRVFGYIVVVATATGLLAGLAPALDSLRADLNAPLKGSGGAWAGLSGGSGGTKKALGWLVSAQVAMSMVLLVEGGLLSQAENRNLRGYPGYDPQKVVAALVHFPETGASVAAAQGRIDAIRQRMLALPGVRSVATSDTVPLFHPETIELSPPERSDAVQPVDIYTASPGFFKTLGIAFVMGRDFVEPDREAAIVSEALARAFWRGRNPVGRWIEFRDGSKIEVVGVVRNTVAQRFGGSDNPALYTLRHVSATRNVLAIRFEYGAATGAKAVRAALRQVDPELQAQVGLMQGLIEQATEELWNFVLLIVILGSVATVLSMTGIYGAVSFFVAQSTREMGIRVALGATRAGIVRRVLVTGGGPVVRGLVGGLWLSVAMAALLRKALEGAPLRVDSSDPILYLAAVLMLGGAAVGAMAAPARRGAVADPVEALRSE